LGLPWIAPELREGSGEFEAADAGSLPRLLEEAAIRGDVHMHTVATDGRSTIVEMAEAAEARGYGYIAITDHSQALAMANGLNEERALVHLERIRSADAQFRERSGFRIFTGIEVDILADGRLDLDDEVLAQMDVVIGSVHSRFDQSPAAMTDRLLRAIANPNLRILGHPTGRLLLRREPFDFDAGAIFAACKARGVALEINAAPERLDLNDVHARLCRQRGIPIVINTDAHHTRHLDLMRYGVQVARRAWLEAGDVLNTLPADEFLARLRK
ncbi:MAG: PHP domain-containing protein, partial [Terriglobales bacterium]